MSRKRKPPSPRRNRSDGTANFYFLKPATYYVRLLYDLNGNGVWDTGLYEEHRRAEPLYYYNKGIEMRENWDYSEDWNPLATPIDKQKPAEMKKGKAEKKEKKSKNEQREEQKRKRASGQSSSRGGNFGF